MKVKNKIRIPVEIEVDYLDVLGLPQEDLLAFIYAIDDRVACYEFTEALRDHFAEVLRKEDAAQLADAKRG